MRLDNSLQDWGQFCVTQTCYDRMTQNWLEYTGILCVNMKVQFSNLVSSFMYKSQHFPGRASLSYDFGVISWY